MTAHPRCNPLYTAAAFAMAISATGAPVLHAQSGAAIARRVAAAPDGEVRMTYATRADVCGDGRDMVSMGSSVHFSTNMESYGRWSGMTCVHGAARVAVTIRDHEIVAIRPHIGGEWPTATIATLDLGRVRSADAAAYFMSLAARLGDRSRPNPLLAAAIADSVSLAPDMLALARNASLPRETRRRATHWVGVLGDVSMVAPLVALARAGDEGESANPDDVGPGDRLQGAAVGALSMMQDEAGLPALMELARRGSVSLRKAAVFWLGQSDEVKPRALVRAIAADEHEPEVLRRAAVFALGQGSTPTQAEREFLRGLFASSSSERLQDGILMALAQSESGEDTRWMLAQARDTRFPIEVRKKAVFWAGQGHARVADLTALYRDATEPKLREHLIFVLSQREDEDAIEALMGIARSGNDHEMRKKALFWLAQKNDPRVTKLITDLVTR